MSGMATTGRFVSMTNPRNTPAAWLLALAALGLVLPASTGAGEESGHALVLFFGDSLTAGYGVEPEQAFPALLQVRLDSLGRDVRIVNAGLSGETTAAGLRRIDWILRRPVDVFVLELGGNDGLRGLPLEQAEHNLQGILGRVKAKCPDAALIVAGVRLPPNLGPVYTDAFEAMFPRLAAANGAVLIPRLLEGVGGDRELMRPDGIHPNAAGHRRVAETVWAQLAPLLPAAGSAGAAQDLEGRGGEHPPAAEEADGDGEQGDGDEG